MLPTFIALSIPVELIFLLFHISVLYFILSQIYKRNATYASAFFVVYALQCIPDICSYLLHLFHYRFCKYGFLPAGYRPTSIASALFYGCVGYCSSFQFSAHFVIALNRYTCLIRPTVHAKMWSGKRLGLVAGLLVSFPAVFSCSRWFMQADVIDIPGGYIFVPTNETATKISGFVHVSVSLITCLLSCVLECRTFFAFRKMNARYKRQHVDDYRLLLYTMMGFAIHVLMATVYVCTYIVGWMPACLMLAYPYFADFLCLHSPVFLIYTSKRLRYAYLQFYGLRRERMMNTTVTSVDTTKVTHK